MGVKVRERPTGSGEYWIYIDFQGDRKAKKIGKNKKLALEIAKKIEAKLTLGDMGLLEKGNQNPKFRNLRNLLVGGLHQAVAASINL